MEDRGRFLKRVAVAKLNLLVLRKPPKSVCPGLEKVSNLKKGHQGYPRQQKEHHRLRHRQLEERTDAGNRQTGQADKG